MTDDHKLPDFAIKRLYQRIKKLHGSSDWIKYFHGSLDFF